MSDLNPYEEGLALELHEAKGRIKALQKALKDQSSVSDRLAEQLATCEKYRDAYAECDRIGTQAVRDLEAKLAENEVRLRKAVEALDEAVYLLKPDEKDMMRQAGVYRIVTTLAEIKGDSHD